VPRAGERGSAAGAGAADVVVADVVTVVVAALAAAYLPARQVSRVDPIVVLRAE
jgi:ABC-type antimicrobial peptide transport system permease subunit